MFQTRRALRPAISPFGESVGTFEEVRGAPLSHFVSRIHVGHKLGEGAGDGAGPDPCHQVDLPTPENPIGQSRRNQGQGLISS